MYRTVRRQTHPAVRHQPAGAARTTTHDQQYSDVTAWLARRAGGKRSSTTSARRCTGAMALPCTRRHPLCRFEASSRRGLAAGTVMLQRQRRNAGTPANETDLSARRQPRDRIAAAGGIDCPDAHCGLMPGSRVNLLPLRTRYPRHQRQHSFHHRWHCCRVAAKGTLPRWWRKCTAP